MNTFYPHDHKTILEFQNKIDNNISFYDDLATGLEPNSTPYPQLENGNIYDALTAYNKREYTQEIINREFFDDVIGNKHFNIWGAENNYRPAINVHDGNIWNLLIDVKIVVGEITKNPKKEISGYHVMPQGLNSFLEEFYFKHENKAVKIPTLQNIINPNLQIIKNKFLLNLKNKLKNLLR